MELTAKMVYEYTLRKPARDAAEELDSIKTGIRVRAEKGCFDVRWKHIYPLNIDYLKRHGFTITQEEAGDYIISWEHPSDQVYY